MASEDEDVPKVAAANGSHKPSPADVVLPMSGIIKCAKEGLNGMHLALEAKQALHDAALVFISFISSMSYERTVARKLKTMTADDIIAELHSLGFVDMAKSLANSVQDYRTRKSKKRARDADSADVAALPAALHGAPKTPRTETAAAPAPKSSANADLAGMWGIKAPKQAAEHAVVAPGAASASLPGSVGGGSDDDEAPASQEQLAEMAAAFSVDES